MIDDGQQPPGRGATRHRVRDARPDDAGALAEVWVASWRAAYRGLLDDELLDSMSRAQRMAHWLAQLMHGALAPTPGRVFVAEDADARVVGLCETGPVGGQPGAPLGEIFTLYVAPQHWRRGAGAALLEHACADFAGRGFERAILWVLERNAPARRFYERLGMRFDGHRRVEPLRGRPVSLRYGRWLGRSA